VIKRSAAALAATVSAALAATAVAGIGGTGTVYPTTLKASDELPAFHGRVTSTERRCERGRRVRLFEQLRGDERRLLGSDRSDRDGRWKVVVDPLEAGEYVAKVKGSEVTIDGVDHGCGPDFSRTLTVEFRRPG
jgi:hypothetical protein